MKSKIDELCPQASSEELQKLVFAKWATPPHSQITPIHYTFHIGSTPGDLKEKLLLEHTNVTMKSLNTEYQRLVTKTFEKWRQACGEQIAFNYVDTLSADQTGITLIACGNLHQANGLASYNTRMAMNGEININRVLVCLPPEISNVYNFRTILHEMGHALGLEHTHDVESLKQRLMASKQGLGCSVMGYTSVLQSADNHCNTYQYCLNETYAVYPGPLDRQICTALYQSPPYSMYKYYNAAMTGFANGAIDNAVSTFLSNITFLNIDQKQNHYVSQVMAILLRSYLQNSVMTVSNTLAVIELATQAQKNQLDRIFQIFRILVNIASLFMYLYELYANDNAMMTVIYLSAFLIANYCGMIFGKEAGLQAAFFSNAVVNNIDSLLKSGEHAIQDVLPNKLYALKNMFFFDRNDGHRGKSVNSDVIEPRLI